MADQLTLQTIGILLTGLTVSIAAIYYTLTLKYTRKNQELTLKAQEQSLETRQLQLYTTMLNASQSKEYYRSYLDFMYNQEWEDYDDFMRKYGPVSNPEAYLNYIHTLALMQQWGVLVEQKALDPHILYMHSGDNVFRIWEKVEPLINEARERVNPKWLQSFETLYHEMKKIQQQEET